MLLKWGKRMRITEQFEKIYENCLEHMSNTLEDWEKAFNALRNAAVKAGGKPEHFREALKYYDMLEKQMYGETYGKINEQRL